MCVHCVYEWQSIVAQQAKIVSNFTVYDTTTGNDYER